MNVLKKFIVCCVIALHSTVGNGAKCAASKLNTLSSCMKSSGLAYIQALPGYEIFSLAYTGTARRRNIACRSRLFSSRIKVGSFVTGGQFGVVRSISLTIPMGNLRNAEPQWNESQSIPFFPLSRLIHLDEALKAAVNEERYKAASAIRDEIRALRSQDEITRLRLLLDDSVAGMHAVCHVLPTFSPPQTTGCALLVPLLRSFARLGLFLQTPRTNPPLPRHFSSRISMPQLTYNPVCRSRCCRC